MNHDIYNTYLTANKLLIAKIHNITYKFRYFV